MLRLETRDRDALPDDVRSVLSGYTCTTLSEPEVTVKVALLIVSVALEVVALRCVGEGRLRLSESVQVSL